MRELNAKVIMSKNLLYTYFLMISLLMISCSPKFVPFTQDIREEYKLSEQDMKSIQFYISKDIVLKRGEEVGSKLTEDGELMLTKDHYIEEVVIKANTPCIVKKAVDGKTITVQFEEESKRFLVFGSLRNTDGFYTLRALEWNKGRGKINYGDYYYLSAAGSRDVFLSLKMSSIESFSSDQKIIKGKKL